jgi:hypothetical protein
MILGRAVGLNGGWSEVVEQMSSDPHNTIIMLLHFSTYWYMPEIFKFSVWWWNLINLSGSARNPFFVYKWILPLMGGWKAMLVFSNSTCRSENTHRFENFSSQAHQYVMIVLCKYLFWYINLYWIIITSVNLSFSVPKYDFTLPCHYMLDGTNLHAYLIYISGRNI